MSVRPTAFHPDGAVDVWHDEGGHGGRVALADIPFASSFDGSEDDAILALACPARGCKAISFHPAGGGGAPEEVQALHILKQVHGKQRSYTAAKARVAALADGMDGPGRFKHEKTTRGEIESGTPFQRPEPPKAAGKGS